MEGSRNKAPVELSQEEEDALRAEVAKGGRPKASRSWNFYRFLHWTPDGRAILDQWRESSQKKMDAANARTAAGESMLAVSKAQAALSTAIADTFRVKTQEWAERTFDLPRRKRGRQPGAAHDGKLLRDMAITAEYDTLRASGKTHEAAIAEASESLQWSEETARQAVRRLRRGDETSPNPIAVYPVARESPDGRVIDLVLRDARPPPVHTRRSKSRSGKK